MPSGSAQDAASPRTISSNSCAASRRRISVDLSDARLCALESKAQEAGLHEAARELGLELVFLPLAALRARKATAATHSPRVQAMFGVGSVAEAAALVGAGPNSRLVAPRVTTPVAACALAKRGEEENS